ncbi:hypothetical protein L7F22_034384 [Adiantum nelumboides]|nr:hypothetical protein [Adiantum nelumboides]
MLMVARKRWATLLDSINQKMENSMVGHRFKIAKRGTTFTQELRAGTATFLTMAYILAANASILAASGGTCSISDCVPVCNAGASIPPEKCRGMSEAGNYSLHLVPPGPECKFFPVNPGYEACLQQTKQDLVVATAVASLIGSTIMGLWANLPLALAPGMGMNAYFAYTLVGYHGSGSLPYRAALAAVFMEGALFFIIAAVGLRSRLAKLIPAPLRLATTAGIGLFLAFIGLQSDEGLGLLGFNPSTMISLAACPDSSRAPLAPVAVLPNGTLTILPGATASTVTVCLNHHMQSATFWLGAVGFLIIAFSLKKKISGGIIYGILAVTVLSWIRNTPFTYFPHTPQGTASFNYMSRIVEVHAIHNTAGALRFGYAATSQFWSALVTFLYIDLLETTGGMYALAKLAGSVDENGDFEGQYFAFMTDAASIMVGATLGSSPVTVYGESSTGIKEGGRTGLTALTVSFYFFLSLFFTPLLASIPPWAIGPPLVVVGVLLMRPVMEIRWDDMGDAIPAFLTIILMPLTYSIAYGLLAGLGVYLILHVWDWIRQGMHSISVQAARRKTLHSASERAAETLNMITVVDGSASSKQGESHTPLPASHDRYIVQGRPADDMLVV